MTEDKDSGKGKDAVTKAIAEFVVYALIVMVFTTAVGLWVKFFWLSFVFGACK